MRRDGFLLGLLATSGQVLLLRELVTVFGGSELLIGSALFGWLVWVALGAWIGGRPKASSRPAVLFSLGGLFVPSCLLGVRLVSLLVTDVSGEAVPMYLTMLLSIVLVAPVALVSGWLFPVISQSDRRAPEAITTVYLFEGLGAFAAGLIVALLVGKLVGNLGMSLIIGIIVTAAAVYSSSRYRVPPILAGLILVIVFLITGGGSSLYHNLDQMRFSGYTVEQSFDTPYSHQTLLSRQGSQVLVTDNVVEANYPNLQNDENTLIPALVYRPQALSVLYLGRAEFGLSELVTKFPGMHLTAVDPRGRLSHRLDALRPLPSTTMRVEDDPISFLSTSLPHRYDLVILGSGHLDSYRASRMVTPQALDLVKRCLSDSGVVMMITDYDSDRYVSAESAELLSIIANTFKRTFTHVNLWPGNMTLILASERTPLNLSLDTILARIAEMPYVPEFLGEAYLWERLDPLTMERMAPILENPAILNDVGHPILSSREAWSRARKSETDRRLADHLLERPGWLLAVPVLVMGLFLTALISPMKKNRTGMFLYFVAGSASLSLELVTFYLYQSTAGSLYTDMAVLIGVFMLGLSLGTWFGSKTVGLGIGWTSLATLLLATVILGATWAIIEVHMALIYYSLFLLVVALATGGLFVAATRCYYSDTRRRSRGAGYALELAGSAVSALLTATVLLPLIGVTWLLVSLSVMALCGVASLLRCRI